ncbi:GMC family oxidoreductase N-terminal domain-containing protein [Streptomyces sp. ActVer]|uniref:GMC family oxidoreductase N-terminal domain-containing protein n=1 Tax=Streptomyces sp. ActVer TaxID=3014558 RepID=UPI0022B31B34|nr:GMC family oxidoreductase N-terminal domain-containing protein [Streptomyces sp. ActVer]MCZ4511601.1 GMC family oxidoreductase N-terminal domain-containing protein [Streptomyces sp. ActVer]
MLVALCDTTFPSVQHPDDFWQRKASGFGVHTAPAALIEELPTAQAVGIGALLDALSPLPSLPLEAREEMPAAVTASGPEAAGGIAVLRRLTIFLAYGVVDPGTAPNPNWAALGYPGPPDVLRPREPRAPLTLAPDATVPSDADVVVIGSGAGGSVIAAELARAGAAVVVLEAGGHFDESTFAPTELGAYRDLYWRGGPAPTADLNVTLLAGSAVGGGTAINWSTCLPTPAGVREEWARWRPAEWCSRSS